MEPAESQPPHESSEKPGGASKPLIHRVCEGCNNMFATHPGNPERRCPKCRKE